MGSSVVWVILALLATISVFCSADPTDGFTSVPLRDSNFMIQHPYNMPPSDRYSDVDGVHKMWVYSTDKPYKDGSPTGPRTEIRITGYDYSSGVWQFEGYVYVPSGTTGVSIMQIHRADGEKPATDLMLRVYDGELRFYSWRVVEKDIYDRWMRVNVVHDVGANRLWVYVNGVLKLEAQGRGVSKFYFKCGVYEQSDASKYMESRWRGIKVYRRD
ncbi:hypothetical protein HPP92_003994 [Vanilla planifolia]|uniref:Alginate lyase 2 domain-containing protein n=1 Tax=Vanilla planifolia TaxID=51239 RepID=A0A835SGP1_VANPL|nr:hypothetical protein HPP92_003994 [Vanilla planifolia]